MKRIAQKAAIRAATRDVTVGVATGIALTGYRALVLVAFVRLSPAPLSLLGAALLAECVLYALCTAATHRRHEAGAFSLAALYVLRLAFVWYVGGRAVPPVSLVTLLVAYGLYRGIRGTSEIEAMASGIAAALANER